MGFVLSFATCRLKLIGCRGFVRLRRVRELRQARHRQSIGKALFVRTLRSAGSKAEEHQGNSSSALSASPAFSNAGVATDAVVLLSLCVLLVLGRSSRASARLGQAKPACTAGGGGGGGGSGSRFRQCSELRLAIAVPCCCCAACCWCNAACCACC